MNQDQTDQATLPDQINLASGELVALKGSPGGSTLTKAQRKELLASLRAGEPVSLSADIVAYRQSKAARPLPVSQRKEANANFMIFDPATIGRFAKSFKGRPFIRDHAHSITAKAGTIRASELEESAQEFVVRHELEVVKSWAVEGLLDETIQEFSIGAGSRRSGRTKMTCSVCSLDYFGGECAHWRGQEVELDGGRVITEVIVSGSEGYEVSAVLFPAVAGTGVDGVSNFQTEKERILMKTAKTTDKAEAAPETPAQSMAPQPVEDPRVKELELELAAVNEQLAERKAAEAELAAKMAKQADEQKQAAITALHERALNGEGFGGALFSKDSAREKYFLAQCAKSIEDGQAYLATLEPGPVGAEMQSAKSDASKRTGLTAIELKRAKAAGIDPARYEELTYPERFATGEEG